MIPEEVRTWLIDNNFGEVRSTQSISGGCINNGITLRSESGEAFFLKTNYNNPDDMFRREEEGLLALRVDDGPIVPEPFLSGDHFLLLEFLSPAPRIENYWSEFGKRLAALHRHTNPLFGFQHDNYIGSTFQPNPWTIDGVEFFNKHRLRYQAHLAMRKGLLDQSDVKRVETIASRLRDLVPEQPASLLHGDLWSGNAISDADGAPAIIDPAAHFGWAEAELAMTALFGAFPKIFYDSYQEINPLDPGFESRYPIYNLYHLLNHLNIFGGGYLGQVKVILRKYAR